MINPVSAPSHFYKYMSINREHPEWVSRVFTHNELYFSRAEQFNDPFDCRSKLTLESSRQEAREYLSKNYKRNFPNSGRSERLRWISERLKLRNDPKVVAEIDANNWKTINSDFGILCASEIYDDILMWSHYARNHQGLCIRMSDTHTSPIFTERFLRVEYSEEYPIVNPIREDDPTRMTKTAYSKSNHWAYEKEWRIVDIDDGPGPQRFPPQILTGVIFGCRASPEDEDQVREWCKDRDPKPKFYQMREADREYKLVMEDA